LKLKTPNYKKQILLKFQNTNNE